MPQEAEDKFFREGDKVSSYAISSTPQGRMLLCLKTYAQKGKEGLEVRFVDNSMDGAFDWKKWKATKEDPKDEESKDAASLMFKGHNARDAVVWGLWNAIDQLFQLGWGRGVFESQLDFPRFLEFLDITQVKFEIVVLYRTNEPSVYDQLSYATLEHADNLPNLVHMAALKHRNDPNMVGVTCAIHYDGVDTKRAIPMATYYPLVLEKIHDEAMAEDHTPTLRDLYFDNKTEKHVLEDLIRRYFVVIATKQDAGHTDLFTYNARLRQLLAMIDLCTVACQDYDEMLDETNDEQ